MQFTIQFTEAEDGGVLASTLRRIAAAFDPNPALVRPAPKVVGPADEAPAGLKPWLPETASNAPVTETLTALDAACAAADVAREVTKTRRTRSTKAAVDADKAPAAPDTVDVVATPEQIEEVKALAEVGKAQFEADRAADAKAEADALAAAYNAAAAAAGAPTVAEIEKAAEVDPEQERRTLLESIAPMLEKAGFPWYRANVPGGKRLAEISIDEARALHTKVTAHLGGV